jgi:CheY-like chemotaxis protein
VESEVGAGTEFKIYLPRSTETVVYTPKPARANDLPHGTETVLVVEDEPSVRTLALRLLQRYGYTVIEADDGLNALDVLQDFDGKIDLLLVDMIMPNLSGRELVERLKTRYPNMKTLFMSGQSPSAQKGDGSKIENFIRKPFSAFDLIKRVRHVLDTPL